MGQKEVKQMRQRSQELECGKELEHNQQCEEENRQGENPGAGME
jgi:hypothetical protein